MSEFSRHVSAHHTVHDRGSKTPGYNTRLFIAFKTDRSGHPLAYYWSGHGAPGTLGRWIRMPLDEAKDHIAQGNADEAPYTVWAREEMDESHVVREVNFQQGERLRIRSKGPQGQPFESFWYTVDYPMTLTDVALQFAQTGQPGMLIEIVSGKLKWTFQQGRHAGQPTVTRVKGVVSEASEDRISKRFRVGSRVTMSPDALENYGDKYRGVVLKVTHVSTSKSDHPGFDPGDGSALYDLKVFASNTVKRSPLPMSLYDWELEPA